MTKISGPRCKNGWTELQKCIMMTDIFNHSLMKQIIYFIFILKCTSNFVQQKNWLICLWTLYVFMGCVCIYGLHIYLWTACTFMDGVYIYEWCMCLWTVYVFMDCAYIISYLYVFRSFLKQKHLTIFIQRSKFHQTIYYNFIHSHSHIHTQPHTNTPMQTATHTHTHAHSHIHTHAQMHTLLWTNMLY